MFSRAAVTTVRKNLCQISLPNDITEVELSQAKSKLMDGKEITRGKGTFHHHYVLKLQRMVNQEGTSQKLEAQSGRVENTEPSGGRSKRKEDPRVSSPAEVTKMVQKVSHSR